MQSEQRRRDQRLLREQNDPAGWRDGRLNRDRAVLPKLRGRRDHTGGVGLQEIGRDEDIPARPEHRIRQDLTVLQKDELRIDGHIAAAAGAIEHRGADRAIGELHRAGRVRHDRDLSATRLVGLRGDGAIRHGELVARIHRDVPGIAPARARG